MKSNGSNGFVQALDELTESISRHNNAAIIDSLKNSVPEGANTKAGVMSQREMKCQMKSKGPF